MPPTTTSVRPARAADSAQILALVRELAAYEREPDAVLATEVDLSTALFGPEPRVHALVAEVVGGQAAPGELAGMAVWFVTFSTWRGRHGIWLEDLYVRPEHRGLGLGQALLAALAAECARRGWTRLEWNVLDWNEPALGFYRRLGAQPLDEWTVHRLADGPLSALAGVAAAGPGRTTTDGSRTATT
ncbi:MAG: N-acetyltransferase family protein [Kineosporiaceae bacterium]